jgi:hypothetical protein
MGVLPAGRGGPVVFVRGPRSERSGNMKPDGFFVPCGPVQVGKSFSDRPMTRSESLPCLFPRSSGKTSFTDEDE